MEYAVSELVKEVKVLLDRNQESSGLLVPTDSDTLSQGALIKSKIVDAARVIEENAPEDKLETINYSSLQTSWQLDGGSYVGLLSLPQDLLRLVYIKVSDWKRAGEVITTDDSRYAYQQNKYVRGNPERPVAVLVRQNGSRALELYTSNKKDATASVSYVAEPKIYSNGTINLCSLLRDAILYMAGYLVCVSLGDNETAVGLRRTAYQLAGIVEQNNSQ